MWTEITNSEDIRRLMEIYGGFHDGCLYSISYVSGAYVDEDLSMVPFNVTRSLKVVFHRQYRDPMSIEIEFYGLIRLNLIPAPVEYTCEIYESPMFFEDGVIYWGDSSWFNKERTEYTGTWISAERARWRVIE